MTLLAIPHQQPGTVQAFTTAALTVLGLVGLFMRWSWQPRDVREAEDKAWEAHCREWQREYGPELAHLAEMEAQHDACDAEERGEDEEWEPTHGGGLRRKQARGMET